MLETLVLQCFLCVLAQASDPAQPPPGLPGSVFGGSSPAAVEEPTPGTPNQLRPIEPPVELRADPPAESPPRYRPTPPELVAEAMMLPPGHTLTGQPMTLASTLGAVRDRAEQLEVVRAYWRLVEAVAVYRFQLDYERRLEGVQAPPEQAARLAAIRAAAKAQRGEVELQALAAQHALAVRAGLPNDSALPLPADRPHVGPYMTRFRELFAHRLAPPAARRLDRTLPIRFQAIEAQSKAVVAADDAYMAISEAADRGPWTERLDSLTVLHRLQCEWIAAVCAYNQDIAEYAVAVVPPGTNGAGLVGLLIRPSQDPVRPLVSDDADGVEPAGYTEPARAPSAAPATIPPPARGEPTPAVRPLPGEPTPARRPPDSPEPGTGAEPTGLRSDSVLPSRPVVPVEHRAAEGRPGGPVSPARAEGAPPSPALFNADGDAAPLSGDRPASDLQRRTVERPSAVLPPLYPGLAGASPGVQAKQLNLTLHWNRSLPEGSVEPIELLTCLQRRTADRPGLIAAYWTVRERAAAWQVWQQHRQWLEELSYAVADGSPEARRLRTARSAAEAAAVAAHAELVEAQFHLADAIGQSSDAVWPIAVTRPHSGPYLLKVDLLPPELARSWPLRRLADMVPRFSVNVREHATAVVEADAARAEAEAAWLDRAAPFDGLLHALDRQTGQTLAFLAALTAYNQAIADYALRVLPDGTPEEQLVKTLVMAE